MAEEITKDWLHDEKEQVYQLSDKQRVIKQAINGGNFTYAKPNGATSIDVDNLPSWVSFNRNENGSLVITTKGNMTGDQRVATLEMKITDADEKVTYEYITITQGSNNEVVSKFVVIDPNVSCESFDGTPQHEVYAFIQAEYIENVTFECDADFVHNIECDFAMGYISFDVDANISPNARMAQIYVEALGYDNEIHEATIYLTQEASTETFIIVEMNEPTAGYFEGATTATMYSIFGDLDNDSIIFEPSPQLAQYFTWDFLRDMQIIQFTAKGTNESPENDIEIQNNYFKGVKFNEIGVPYYVWSNPFTVIQSAAPATTYFPIWKDSELVLGGDEDYLTYRVLDELDTNKVIYNGRAYNINGVIKVRINKILENYLKQSLNIGAINTWQNTHGFASFAIQKATATSWSDEWLVRVYNNWTYTNEDFNYNLNDVIETVVDSRQLLPISVADQFGDNNSTRVIIDYTFADGTFQPSIHNITNDFETYIAGDFDDYQGKEVVEVDVAIFKNGEGSPMYDHTYKIGCTNNKYCLYYKNLKGGYDYIFANPTSTHTYTLTSSEFKTNELNTSVNHNTVVYENSNVRKWNLHTNLFNDKQSERFKNVITSNQCWLHNLESGEITPVNISTKNTQIKTRKSNNKKPISYQFEVTEAKERIIR